MTPQEAHSQINTEYTFNRKLLSKISQCEYASQYVQVQSHLKSSCKNAIFLLTETVGDMSVGMLSNTN